MIRTRSPLYRQVQNFFHSHLLGIYRWDDVEHAPAQKVEKKPGTPWEGGKIHDKIEMRFGPFDLTVLGPFEDPAHPCGRIEIQTGRDAIDGPLDPGTWDRVAGFIKDHKTEEDHGITAGSDWGR